MATEELPTIKLRIIQHNEDAFVCWPDFEALVEQLKDTYQEDEMSDWCVAEAQDLIQFILAEFQVKLREYTEGYIDVAGTWVGVMADSHGRDYKVTVDYSWRKVPR